MLIVDVLLALGVIFVLFAVFTPPIKSVLLSNESHRKEPDAEEKEG